MPHFIKKISQKNQLAENRHDSGCNEVDRKIYKDKPYICTTTVIVIKTGFLGEFYLSLIAAGKLLSYKNLSYHLCNSSSCIISHGLIFLRINSNHFKSFQHGQFSVTLICRRSRKCLLGRLSRNCNL